jgi:hypothetical protein
LKAVADAWDLYACQEENEIELRTVSEYHNIVSSSHDLTRDYDVRERKKNWIIAQRCGSESDDQMDEDADEESQDDDPQILLSPEENMTPASVSPIQRPF